MDKLKLKNRLKNSLKEAKFMVKPEDVDQIVDKLGANDVVKITDESVEIDEKSESKAQQRFMGMVYKCKKTGDCASEAVRKAAENMSEKDAEDFASTKHKGLPEKVEEIGDDYERASKEEWEELMRQIHTSEPPADENSEQDVQENESGVEQGVDVNQLTADVQKFMDKLNLGQFEAVLAKIDKPVEQAEIIAAFAERIGIPRAKLPMILQSMRGVAENVNPRMKKRDLVEMIKKRTNK